MIKIGNNDINSDILNQQYSDNSIQLKIFSKLFSSNTVYRYASIDELKFELELRKNIIDASYELNDSRFSFKVFRDSKCNTDYWDRTDEGGFRLRSDVKPSEAIKDIYINSAKYGTECSTAMVIIYYKALLAQYPEELFNKTFSQIYPYELAAP